MHKNHIVKTREQGIVTLGLVFGVGMLALGILSLLLTVVVTNLATFRNASEGLRSLASADAGAREGVYQFLGSDTYAGSADWAALASGGTLNSVTASAVSVDHSAWPVVRILGTADNELTHRGVQYDILPSQLSLGFSHAIYAQHNLAISGNVTVQGNVYSGGSIDIDSASARVNGDAHAVAGMTLKDEDNIQGTMVENTVVLTPPDINPAPYRTSNPKCNETIGNSGMVSNTIKWSQCSVVYLRVPPTKQVKGGWPSTWNGVLLIEGDASMNGGRFSCAGSCTNPLAIYVDGNLDLAGNVEVHGLVYVTGKTTVGTGNPEITGSLMSIDGVQGMDINGNLRVTYDPAVMGNWHNIGGLDMSGHTPPAVSGWREL